MPTVVFRADKDDLDDELQSSYLNSDIIEMPPKEDSAFAPLSVGGYIGLILLTCLPVVNLIFLVVYASGGAKKVAVRNYSKAALILLFFTLVLFLTLWIALGDFWNIFMKNTLVFW